MVDVQAKPFHLSDAQAQWVARTLAGMSTEEKVGQLFLVMGGDYAPDVLADMVRRGRVGGVLFRPAEKHTQATNAKTRNSAISIRSIQLHPIMIL